MGCVWCCDTPDYDNNNPQNFVFLLSNSVWSVCPWWLSVLYSLFYGIISSLHPSLLFTLALSRSYHDFDGLWETKNRRLASVCTVHYLDSGLLQQQQTYRWIG